MQRAVLPIIILFWSCSSMVDKIFTIPNDLYDYKKREPVMHAGHYDPITDTGKWINYLAIDLPYPPIKKIRESVEKTFQINLAQTEKTRGKEAHLTVLTPPEYWVLHSHLKMQEINTIFLPRVQSLNFRIKCLARAQKEKNQTYFLVAESEDIINFRKEINQLFIKNGGDPGAFDPEEYYPHITVGFNMRDLHERDDIFKSTSYCKAHINDKYSKEKSK